VLEKLATLEQGMRLPMLLALKSHLSVQVCTCVCVLVCLCASVHVGLCLFAFPPVCMYACIFVGGCVNVTV